MEHCRLCGPCGVFWAGGTFWAGVDGMLAERCGLTTTQVDNLAPSIEDSGTNPAAFSYFAPIYDFCQPIPATGIVAIETAVANSSRCAVSQQSPWPAGAFLRDGIFRDERGRVLTRQPVGPFGIQQPSQQQ